ncbi:DUF5343 domain-containing protein [Brevundimonas diminuta ATCC 11568]
MRVKLPYMSTPGLIPKILGKIQEARRPERFTQDFLETKLGHSGGSARAIIPLLKRMGFLTSDGTPTPLYDQFRNPSTERAALAQGTRNAYSDVFDRNRYAGDLTRDKFAALVTEITGLEKDSSVGSLIVSTFWKLREGSDFEADLSEDSARTPEVQMPIPDDRAPTSPPNNPSSNSSNEVKLNVGYTINLNLPETTNPEVFNAIFRSLKEHLISRQ